MKTRKFENAVKEILKPCERKVPRSGELDGGFDELDYELLSQAARIDDAFESAMSSANSIRSDLDEAIVRMISGYLPSYDALCGSRSNDYSRALAVAESLRRSLFSTIDLVVGDNAGKRLTKLLSDAVASEQAAAG